MRALVITGPGSARVEEVEAPVSGPSGNAWRAATAAGAAPGRRVLVCGPGTIGLLTTAFATAAGAGAPQRLFPMRPGGPGPLVS